MAAAVSSFFFLRLAVAAAAAAIGASAALVEHTFVVRQVSVRHLGKDTEVPLVNGQLPGPAIEVTQGDSLAVHVVNSSPYNLTIHWHGVKQRLNCWADGVGMITQCPIQPNNSFTYRFDVVGQEGTLWWHAHVACLRATVYGALIIRPKFALYPFPPPDDEIPIMIGDWWQADLARVDKNMLNGSFDDLPRAATINGKLGDVNHSAGEIEESYVVNIEHGRRYLLRIMNAALYSDYYFKIAGHEFTVVAADANYVKPYTTDVIAISPGETVDAIVVANAPPGGRYFMVAMAGQPPKPDTQVPMYISRGVVQYRSSRGESPSVDPPPVAPEMPDQHDTMTTFYFHGNLTSLAHPRSRLPVPVDEHLFITLGQGSICRDGSSSCNRKIADQSIGVATMNNISFHFPARIALLEAHYDDKMSSVETLQELPQKPEKIFNFTDPVLIDYSVQSRQLEPTTKATLVRRFRYNTSVEIVFQGTSMLQGEPNPMHLHGHDFFILAQGIGNYDAERDVKSYNLVDPPLRNTVRVPNLGWAVIRFIANNPGVWFLHCHFEFHVSMGMAVAFQVDNGPTSDATLPPPPADFPRCGAKNLGMAYQ